MGPPMVGYRCIGCLGELARAPVPEWRCPHCARAFPCVGGIPILTLRPRALAVACALALDQERTRLASVRTAVATAPAACGDGFAARASRLLQGRARNLELVSDCLAPVADYLRAQPDAAWHAIDWIAAHTGGWSAQSMLPYFYQDWAGTTPFADVRSLILDALAHHRPDARTIAILGAGAGGLVQAAAADGRFSVIHGIDLSLPTLLIAQRLLQGETIDVHLETAGWQRAPLPGASPPAAGVHLAAADAAALPFGDAALPAIVTQYLMDVVGHPLAVIEEIARTLEPGGVWINFSAPFSLPAEPSGFGSPALDELPDLLAPFGFTIEAAEWRHFVPMDLTALDPRVKVTRETVHFFTARRVDRPVARTPRGDDARWWGCVPVRLPGGKIRVPRPAAAAAASAPASAISASAASASAASATSVVSTVSTASATAATPAAAAGTAGSARAATAVVAPAVAARRDAEIEVAGMRVSVPAAVAEMVGRVIDLIDGTRSAAGVHAALAAEGRAVAAADLRELLTYLHRHYGVIDLRPPAAAPARDDQDLPGDLPADRVLFPGVQGG